MQKVLIAGVGMTPFTKSPGRGVRDLATAAAREAVAQSGVGADQIDQMFLGNAVAGIISQQEMIRGQVAFRHSEFAGIPIINVENACCSGGSALYLGWQQIAGGLADVVLVVGAEQLTHDDKARTFAALRGSTDIDEIGEADPTEIAINSILMDFYAAEASKYLEQYGASREDFARVAVKNRGNAVHNPLAQYRGPQTIEEILDGRMVVSPLNLAMCSPVTDGAAAVVLCSEAIAAKLPGPTLTILASEIAGASAAGDSPVIEAAAKAYRRAGVGPDDLDVIELHDAAAPAELTQYSEIGLCEEGEGHHLLRAGMTEIGGATPVNTSGGLLSRGHPLGATGIAQVCELWLQLLGRADGRQVEHARTGMAINAGGWLNGTYAVTAATVVQRES
jgi:acetyl-CoA acyltransferase